MPIFRFDAKLGTKVPLIQGDDISNGSIGYGKLDEELKKRLDDISNGGGTGGGESANVNLYVSELDLTGNITDHINGDKPSRYRVVRKVGKLNVPVGVLEVFSDEGQHQLTEILSTNYAPDSDGRLTFSSHRDSYLHTYHRFYIPQTVGGVVYMERGTWTDWIPGTDDLINERIEAKVDKSDRITDDDINGIVGGGGGGNTGGGSNCSCDLTPYLKKAEAAATYPTKDEVKGQIDECVKVVDRITDKDIDDIDLSGGGSGGNTGGNTGGGSNCNCDMTEYLKKRDAESTYAKIADVVNREDRITDSDIEGLDLSSGGSSGGNTGGGGSTAALELRVASLEAAVAGKVSVADSISAGEISDIIGNNQ